jgi:transcription initiation factor TFIIIB Brf1 subunit/transcription initiation factor TFIIB
MDLIYIHCPNCGFKSATKDLKTGKISCYQCGLNKAVLAKNQFMGHYRKKGVERFHGYS